MFEINEQLFSLVTGGMCMCIQREQWTSIEGNNSGWSFTNTNCGLSDPSVPVFLKCGGKDVGNITYSSSGGCSPYEQMELYCWPNKEHPSWKCFGVLNQL